VEFDNYTWRDGKLEPADRGMLKVEKKHQIANFADWCNECGNCDTFCPEYGGPFIQKPSFFQNREAWLDSPHRDGFYITRHNGIREIVGRIEGKVCSLAVEDSSTRAFFNDGILEATFDTATHNVLGVKPLTDEAAGHYLNVKNYHTLRILLAGLLNPSRVHQVNVPYLAATFD